MRIELEDAKYTYIYQDGEQYALRYGETWRDLTGDKFIYCLATKIIELQEELTKLKEASQYFLDSCEECQDFDGFTAMLISMDDYHAFQEVIDGEDK